MGKEVVPVLQETLKLLTKGKSSQKKMQERMRGERQSPRGSHMGKFQGFGLSDSNAGVAQEPLFQPHCSGIHEARELCSVGWGAGCRASPDARPAFFTEISSSYRKRHRCRV